MLLLTTTFKKPRFYVVNLYKVLVNFRMLKFEWTRTNQRSVLKINPLKIFLCIFIAQLRNNSLYLSIQSTTSSISSLIAASLLSIYLYDLSIHLFIYLSIQSTTSSISSLMAASLLSSSLLQKSTSTLLSFNLTSTQIDIYIYIHIYIYIDSKIDSINRLIDGLIDR